MTSNLDLAGTWSLLFYSSLWSDSAYTPLCSLLCRLGCLPHRLERAKEKKKIFNKRGPILSDDNWREQKQFILYLNILTVIQPSLSFSQFELWTRYRRIDSRIVVDGSCNTISKSPFFGNINMSNSKTSDYNCQYTSINKIKNKLKHSL